MKWALIGAALFACGVMLNMSSDYMQYKPTRLTVLEKYIQPGGYKSSGSPVMVLKTEDGRIFDRHVSYATHYRFAKGDRIVMDLRRMDLQQSAHENALYFFAPVILWSFGGALFLVFGVYTCVARYRPKSFP